MKPAFVLVTLLLPAAAHADEAAPAAPATADKKIQLSAGLFYGLPQGDFKEFSGMDLIGSSPGLALAGGYQVIPKLSIVGGLRYFKVASEIDGVDLSSYELQAGARYAHPVSPVLSVFGEALVEYAAFSAEISGGGSSDSSGVGFAIGGGVQYTLNPNVSLGGGLHYSSASLEPDMGDSQSSGWITLTASASYHL